eukprot:TRINITY_DN2282_c0_g2_i1.p1 TRINITY_DN2282_c0_g2~~TRINITY_DN2282_c0_g2_i1.p1  ORF type:complete len:473 (-),score=69.39 TRINITY_DN2282_c0_g2_i1:55-1473(-)
MRKQRFKWTHELEVDFWNVVDSKGINSLGKDIWKSMKNKDIVTVKQVTSHMKYVNKSTNKPNDFPPVEIPLENVDNNSVFSCIDLETTGFGRNAEIISIALVSSYIEVEDYYCYIDPTRSVSREASKVNKFSTKTDTNGIFRLYKDKRPIVTIERVNALRTLVETVDLINSSGKNHYLLAHNGHIADFTWLFRELIEYSINHENIFKDILLCDTMKWAKNIFNNPKLIKNENIYKHCYNKTFDAHDALVDAKATLAWVLNEVCYPYIDSLKLDFAISFTNYINKFLKNEEILYKKDVIDLILEDPTIMAYSTRKKIVKINSVEEISNIIKESDDIYNFHDKFGKSINVRKSTSIKIFENLEDIDIMPKWICSNCNKRMREYTSKKKWSFGRKFYACFKHNQFCWKNEDIVDFPTVHSLERHSIVWDIKERSSGNWFIEKTIGSVTDIISFQSKNRNIVYKAIDSLYEKLTSS